nr:Rv3654c family TadE-like protein [Cellulomonas sp. C5510]
MLVLALVAVTVALATLLGLLASAHAARGRAQAAADLAALAGAQRALVAGDACGLAREVATRNGAGLDRCRELPGAVVEVAASVPGVWGVASAAARAGPRAAT